MDSSSDAESGGLSSRLPTSAPSSPPPADSPDRGKMAAADAEEKLIQEEEEKARLQNERTAKKKYSRKPKKALTAHERQAKAKELEALLLQSQAFSDILTQRTEVLGRVGVGIDGQVLGEHNLQMAKQPSIMTGGTLKDYQLEGLTWLYEVCLQGMSGILADEMGLGKTLQTISLIALLREKENYFGPFLVVAPLSTLSNWMDEFHKWTPTIPVVMYHGLPKERKEIFKTKLQTNYKEAKKRNEDPIVSEQFPVVCTSYEMVLRDHADLSRFKWAAVIIDEGHRMKNVDSQLSQTLKTFTSASRLLITGTPLQNNLKELWSLLNFLLPNIFRDWDAFDSWFDFSGLEDEEGTEQFIRDQMKQDLLSKMHRILQPLLLRRIKADVIHNLPKKREYILYAPMTKEQTDLYNVINDKTQDTREFLQNKVIERLTATAKDSPSPSPKTSSKSSRASSVKSATRKQEPVSELPIRSSPRSRKVQERPVQANNAFALMMRKSQPKKAQAITEPVEPVKQNTKRKNPVTEESPAPKSLKSSRESTPGSVRGRLRRGRKTYEEADASDEDLLSDDEFEAKLVDELSGKAQDTESDVDEEEVARAQTLEMARKEIGSKKLGNPIMQLRLVCNSPHNFYNPWASGDGAPVDESIVTASGKMLLLDRLLPALFKKGHKALIFSQFKTQLDIIEDYCRELRGWNICRIDGSVSQTDRRAQIEAFNTDPDYKLFLLSTRAGGQGINLASADTVILFDSDWNPQQDLQAQDRCHRIGQTRPVVVFRLATKGTVEEDLLLSADAKRRLEKLVIKKGGFRTMGQKMDGGDGEDLDKDLLRSLLLKDGEVYRFSGDREILSAADLRVLLDRSDAAYDRAATGDGNADGYTVVETRANGLTSTGGITKTA